MKTSNAANETLSERLARISNEIYERTLSGPNWVMHTHGPDDCLTCKMVGPTQADWNDALSE